jgi:hypothetical protein
MGKKNNDYEQIHGYEEGSGGERKIKFYRRDYVPHRKQ